MDKQAALKELKELQERATALEEIIKAPDVALVYGGVFLRVPNTEKPPSQYFITTDGKVNEYSSVRTVDVTYGFAYTTEAKALLQQRYLKLVQELRVARAADWGSVRPVWGHDTASKYVIKVDGEAGVHKDVYANTYHPVSFRTAEARDAFFNRYTAADLRLLIKGYDYEGFYS